MIRFTIYDTDNTLLVDPEETANYLEAVSWDSHWPIGYGSLRATVRRDTMQWWAVKTGKKLVARDGGKTVYSGRINAPKLKAGQASITAQGWYVVLNERTLRKRWVDLAALSHLYWSDARFSEVDQNRAVIEKRPEVLRYAPVPMDTVISGANQYHEDYDSPSGSIRRLTFDWTARTGEGLDVVVYNVDQAADEATVNYGTSTPGQGDADIDFTQGDTDRFTLVFRPGVGTAADTYDQNDYFVLTNMVVYADYEDGHSVSTPAYNVVEIIEDIILLARGSDISADMSGIGNPGTRPDAFATKNDGFEAAAKVAERLAMLSNVSNEIWGLAVWGGDAASDGLPLAVFSQRDTSDYDYVVSRAELADWEYTRSDDELFNYVTVKWEDETGRIRYLSPDDDSALSDSTSITTYGERHAPTLDAGVVGQGFARQMAIRYLQYHKDPLDKGRFVAQGFIKSKAGIEMPVSWVRGGDRLRVIDLDKTLFIRQVSYDVNSDRVTMTPDLPPEDIVNGNV